MPATDIVSDGFGTFGSVYDLPLDGFTSIGYVASTLTTDGYGLYGRINGMLRDGFAAYTNLPEPPPFGQIYIDITSLVYVGYSIEFDLVPPAELGDIVSVDLATVPNSFAVTLYGDGTYVVAANFDISRQTFTYQRFRPATNVMDARTTIIINDFTSQQAVCPLLDIKEVSQGTVKLTWKGSSAVYFLQQNGVNLGTYVSAFTTTITGLLVDATYGMEMIPIPLGVAIGKSNTVTYKYGSPEITDITAMNRLSPFPSVGTAVGSH